MTKNIELRGLWAVLAMPFVGAFLLILFLALGVFTLFMLPLIAGQKVWEALK